MAIVSVFIGGIVGLGSFLGALFLYDANFLWALTIYSVSGVTTTLTLIALLMIAQATKDAAPRKAKIRGRVPN